MPNAICNREGGPATFTVALKAIAVRRNGIIGNSWNHVNVIPREVTQTRGPTIGGMISAANLSMRAPVM
jgi:hypothetical protein